MILIGGASTSSRGERRTQTKLKAISAQGSTVLLEDGNYYQDYQCGLHGGIFGYNPRWLKEALKEAVELGPISSIPHRYEGIVPEVLAQLYPNLRNSGIRWMSNGSDACGVAAKLAREFTGREKIVSQGYHGFHSMFATPPESATRSVIHDMRGGCLDVEKENLIPLGWLGEIPDFKDVAAIFIEAPPIDGGGDRAKDWLCHLLNFARSRGVITVLDEIVTGFRYGSDGALGYYGIAELIDLVCLGKTLTNGAIDCAALVGRKDIMGLLTRGVHGSATFWGNPLALAAAKATMEHILEFPPWDGYDGLYTIGDYLKNQWNALDLPYKLDGHSTRPVIVGADERFDDLAFYLFVAGHIVFAAPWYTSTATTRADVDSLIEAAGEWA
jgi:aminotransferase MxcL